MTKMYEEVFMNRSPSGGSTTNSRRGPYVFALSRTPSIEKDNQHSSFGNSYAASSPGLLAEHHGPFASTSTSRRSSIQSASNNVTATTKNTTTNTHKGRIRKRDRILQFAKMKNPTLSIQITPEWTVDFTYAELLQYASMTLTGRRIVQFYWPLDIDPNLTTKDSSSLQHLFRTPMIIYWNMILFIIASASIEGRKRAEQLGLRRTCLMLCFVLFATASIVALWPIEKLDPRNLLQNSSRKDLLLRIPHWSASDSAVQICHESDCKKAETSKFDIDDSSLRQLSQPCLEDYNGKNPSFVRIRTDDDHTILVLCNTVHVQ
jgi:hypothetical protein